MAGTLGAVALWALGARNGGERKTTVRVGSRKSELAMIQTNSVVAALKALNPMVEFEVHTLETIGDKVLDVALSKIGSKNLFTKELETLLLSGDVDFVVHSLKDLPTTLPEGLAVGAICEREDPRDAVIFRSEFSGRFSSLGDLPGGAVVGTSSLRRTAQLQRLYPALIFESVRGNLNTRLAKLDKSTSNGGEGHAYSALVLAAAGVHRMGWRDRIGEYLDPTVCPYAVGQGSIGIECRDGDASTLALLRGVNHDASARRCAAERAYMRALEGGCSVPIGVSSKLVEGDVVQLRGAVHSLDGTERVESELTTTCVNVAEAEAAGLALARDLVAKGAKRILDKIPRHAGPSEKPSTEPK